MENGSRRKELILCLHDFSDFWYGWRNQLKGLSDSFWVVALDLKGFGDSDKPFMASKYRDDVILEELKKFVDVLQENDKKIIVMGHGLGGQIGWRFVERYPETVSKFISISTPHPHIWLRHVMRSWRSIIENRWLYVCRLPFLPEMEMMANNLKIFDSRFQKWNSLQDVTYYGKVNQVLENRYLVLVLLFHNGFGCLRKRTDSRSRDEMTGTDHSTTTGISA